jgi:hypothetical protein
MDNGSYALIAASAGRNVCRSASSWVDAGVVPTTSTRSGRTAKDWAWLIAVAGILREKLATEPGARVLPSEVRATSATGCSPVEVAQLDTASRLVRGLLPMSASATGEAIATEPSLWTLPMIVIALLGTAIAGVMVLRETVTVAERASAAVTALAVGEDERTASSEIASSAAEAPRRLPLLGIWPAVTSPPPGAPRRPGRSAVHWGR